MLNGNGNIDVKPTNFENCILSFLEALGELSKNSQDDLLIYIDHQ